MPVYEYLCDACGDFTSLRPMSAYAEPCDCPDCGEPAPRVMLTAPHFASMSRERMTAHATNERSSHAPMSTDEYKAKSHGANCSCCSGGMKSRTRSRTAKAANGAKSFPSARPWMISH